MKSKKWTLAGLAVLLVAGGAPWGVGYVTEQQWREATKEVNRAQPFLSLETEDYQRGILGSEVSVSVTLRDAETGDAHTLGFDIQVTHGITGSLMDVRPRQGWQPEGADWFPDADPNLTLETRLWGSATLELQAPVTQIDNLGGDTVVRSSGGLVRIDVGRLGQEADLLMVWPGFRLRDPAMDVAIENIHVEQSMAWLVGDIWTGSGLMTVDTVTLQAPQSPAMVFSGMTIDSLSEAGQSGERLSSRATLALESATLGDQSYGPHRLEVSLENLDVASWNDFSNVMAEMQSLALASDNDPRAAFEQQMAMMQRFNGAVRSLAAEGFSAGIRELSVATPEGEVTGSLDISHPELSDRQRDSMLMVMQELTGSVNVSMPVALAEDYPLVRMQVAPLIKEGLLVQDGDRLVLDGRLEDLVLTVNDLDIPLPPLL
ncbi:DUF945 family protein [Marinobacter sp. VGCF2001]|uniref:DUF945 family protein n=1 Tax=Marinobacter sp. VGCF2001 TaxID=3417189 RepID=UPI003CF0054F